MKSCRNDAPEADQRVATPIQKPGVSGDDGAGVLAFDNKGLHAHSHGICQI